ncbi:MAG: hypothetical protein OEW50_13185 [Gammaproteobacteria bacterium]|nr:hypothetical protein [Gammaproteobacteria bacterium]MDH5228350.1 hypothetical protein [Gammaproteobacteria bacterium]
MKTKSKTVRSLAVGTALLLGVAAQAQNAPVGSSAAQAALQGTWNVRMTPYDCATGQTFPAVAFLRRLGIHAGGTLAEANFNPTFQPGQRSSGLGSWERTGPKTYRALTEAYVFFASQWYARGFQRIDEAINLEDADHYVGSGRVEFTDEQGNVGITGCFNTVGERQQ